MKSLRRPPCFPYPPANSRLAGTADLLERAVQHGDTNKGSRYAAPTFPKREHNHDPGQRRSGEAQVVRFVGPVTIFYAL
jgi:hypothetical protein